MPGRSGPRNQPRKMPAASTIATPAPKANGRIQPLRSRVGWSRAGWSIDGGGVPSGARFTPASGGGVTFSARASVAGGTEAVRALPAALAAAVAPAPSGAGFASAPSGAGFASAVGSSFASAAAARSMPSRAAASRICSSRATGMVPRSFQPWTVVTATPSFLAIGRMPPKAAMIASALSRMGVVMVALRGRGFAVSDCSIRAIRSASVGDAAASMRRHGTAMPGRPSAAATASLRQKAVRRLQASPRPAFRIRSINVRADLGEYKATPSSVRVRNAWTAAWGRLSAASARYSTWRSTVKPASVSDAIASPATSSPHRWASGPPDGVSLAAIVAARAAPSPRALTTSANPAWRAAAAVASPTANALSCTLPPRST